MTGATAHERTNEDRVRSARRMLAAYDSGDPDDVRATVVDALADLLHLLRAECERDGEPRESGIDSAESAHAIAWRHFYSESFEEGRY